MTHNADDDDAEYDPLINFYFIFTKNDSSSAYRAYRQQLNMVTNYFYLNIWQIYSKMQNLLTNHYYKHYKQKENNKKKQNRKNT